MKATGRTPQHIHSTMTVVAVRGNIAIVKGGITAETAVQTCMTTGVDTTGVEVTGTLHLKGELET